MNALIRAAADLQAVCEVHQWRFCFIGGLGGLPFEELAVARSTVVTYPPDVPLRTCSAEDLIVLKAFADRPKDWMDIEGVIIRQSAGLGPAKSAQAKDMALRAARRAATSGQPC